MTLTAAFALLAAVPALAQTQKAPPSLTSQYNQVMTQKQVNLSPIVVHGEHMPLPVALQLYKKALTRPWSSHRAELNKLVCRWHTPMGTHMQSLFCMTNLQHRHLRQGTTLAITNSLGKYDARGRPDAAIRHAFRAGAIPAILSKNQVTTPRSTLAPILKTLPPANASYTLRVTNDQGKPVLDYIIKNGDLVHINHYVYKKGQGKPHSGGG